MLLEWTRIGTPSERRRLERYCVQISPGRGKMRPFSSLARTEWLHYAWSEAAGATLQAKAWQGTTKTYMVRGGLPTWTWLTKQSNQSESGDARSWCIWLRRDSIPGETSFNDRLLASRRGQDAPDDLSQGFRAFIG
eukprot:5448746-Pyramimonas_sp.AAC.1